MIADHLRFNESSVTCLGCGSGKLETLALWHTTILMIYSIVTHISLMVAKIILFN